MAISNLFADDQSARRPSIIPCRVVADGCASAPAWRRRRLDGEPVGMSTYDREQLLTALTTEHFTLQGARSQTISETSARASVYMLSVSSALVALGFVSQMPTGSSTVSVAFALKVRLW
jgi:hypothetical protein